MKRITASELKYAGRPRAGLPAWFSNFPLAGAKKRFAADRKRQLVSHFVSAGEIVVCLSVMHMTPDPCPFRVHRKVAGIHISLHGMLDYLRQGSGVPVPEGTVSFFDLDPSDFLVQLQDRNYACLDVFYPPEMIQRYRDLSGVPDEVVLHGQIYPATAHILDIVHRIQASPYKGRPAKTYLQLLAAELLLAVAAIYARQGSTSTAISPRTIVRMEEVRTFLDNNYINNFTIGELARKFAMNTTALKANFHAVTGMALYAYVLSKRMTRAKELLLTTQLSIAEIAYQVGYKTPGTFIRAYKKAFGYTPAQKRGQ